MHARKAILDALATALQGTSPAYPVYQEDETATQQPCFQIDAGAETPRGDDTTKDAYGRVMLVRVTCRGSTLAERETLAELLELALLDEDAPSGPFEVQPDASVEFQRLGDGAQKSYTATYTIALQYFTQRRAPSVLA